MNSRRIIQFTLENLIWFILIAVLILFSILSPRFLQPITIINILLHASVLGILVVGQTFVLTTGNFDLSAESTLGLAAMVGVWLVAPPGPPGWGHGIMLSPFIAVPLMLFMGAAIGWTNGTLITRGKMNNFVVTLSMLIILRGAVLATTSGQTVAGAPDIFNVAGSAFIGPIPLAVIIMFVTFAIAYIVMRFRPFGRELYAIGGNYKAALASGIDPNKRVLQAYIISGVLAAFAGWVLAGRVTAVPLNLGQGMIFEVFAAAVIGGISLQGGRGSMIGAFGGVLLLSAITTGLNLLAVDVFWIETIRGLIILIAMFIDAQKVRYRARPQTTISRA